MHPGHAFRSLLRTHKCLFALEWSSFEYFANLPPRFPIVLGFVKWQKPAMPVLMHFCVSLSGQRRLSAICYKFLPSWWCSSFFNVQLFLWFCRPHFEVVWTGMLVIPGITKCMLQCYLHLLLPPHLLH